MENDAQIKAAENHWDALNDWRYRMPPRSRWNESPEIVRDQNFRICGKYLDGENAGLAEFFKEVSKIDRPLAKGVSVGCGTGAKEMRLIQAGIVDHFDLCDLSSVSLAQGQQIANEWGLQDKVTFKHGNAFEHINGEIYDLVYWDNALHHMQSARESVEWSYGVLNSGGWFLMTEYVGANRFQWPDDVILVINSVRNLLPDSVFYNPRDPDNFWPRTFRAPTLQEMEYDRAQASPSTQKGLFRQSIVFFQEHQLSMLEEQYII